MAARWLSFASICFMTCKSTMQHFSMRNPIFTRRLGLMLRLGVGLTFAFITLVACTLSSSRNGGAYPSTIALPTPVATYAQPSPIDSREADASTFGLAAPLSPTVTVVAEGLLGPIGMAALPDGTLLVAEEGTGERNASAGVSMITPDGKIGRFITGLFSTRDAGDLAGVPLISLAPDGRTLYVGNFGQGHLWTLALTDEQLATGLTLPEVPYTPDDLGKAMLPLNNVMLTNPFDIAYAPDGAPVVSDASGNGVATTNADGTTRFIHRFALLDNPVQPTNPIEAVPAGIIRRGDEYWVTLLGGCPYPAGGGQLVAIDTARNQRTIVDGLNMPIDVAQSPDGTVWLLEFATFPPGGDCFSGRDYQVDSGRLSRLRADGTLETVLDNLNFPGAVLPMADGSLYISEVLPGRILHVTFDEEQLRKPAASLAPAVLLDAAKPATSVGSTVDPTNLDAAFRAVINAHQLQPDPGADRREDASPLSELGMLLFFDPILSGDENIACATCHHPSLAMADARVLPIGTGGHGLGPERRFLETVALAADAESRATTGSRNGCGRRYGAQSVHRPICAAQFAHHPKSARY